MLGLIYGFLFALFIGSAFLMDKKPESLFWVKIAVYFMAGGFILNINHFSLPLGFLIGLLYMDRKSNFNRSIKFLGLMFGFAYFLISLTLPNLSIKDIYENKEIVELKKKFDHPAAVITYTPQSGIQRSIERVNMENPNDEYKPGDTIMMFRTWVLDAEHIAITNPEWLWRCDQELGFYWLSEGHDENTRYELIQFNDDHRTYFGAFKRKNAHSPFYLRYVIESKGTKTPLQEDGMFPFPTLNF